MANSTTNLDYSWQNVNDTALRPNLMVIQVGSGYRPATSADFISNTTFASGVNVNVTGIVNNEQVTQIASSGNPDTANYVFVDPQGRMLVRPSGAIPSVPATQDVYGITLTGVGSFSNYSASVPNVQGVITISVEPGSANTDSVYYAFASSASTGNAFELRGDKVFEVSGTQNLYFAQAASGQRVMVHYQKY